MKTTDANHGWSRSALIVMLSLIPVILPSQSIWVDRADNRYASVEMLKPNFKHDTENLTAYAAFLSFRLPVSGSARLAFELPLAYEAYWYDHYEYGTARTTRIHKSETAIGNPYFGIETSRGGSVFLEAGLRLPFASEKKSDALFLGLFTDFDRIEAFEVKMLPLQVSLNVASRNASGIVMRFRGGLDFWINTDSESERNTSEVWTHYSAQAGFEGEQLSLLAGVTGRLYLSESGLAFRERIYHQLGINAGVNVGRFRPALFARFPLNRNLSDVIRNVIGMNCSIRLE